MVYAFSILYAFLSLIGFLKRWKFLLNPVTVMFGIWAVLLPLSAQNAYQVQPISDKALFIIFVGLMGYLIGESLANRDISVYCGNIRLSDPHAQYEFNYKLLLFLYVISSVYLISAASVAFRLLARGYTLDYIRKLATSEGSNELRSSTLAILMKNFVATPTVYLAIAVLPIDFLMGKKNKILAIMTPLMMFCWVISCGGRSILLWCVLYIVAVFAFSGKKIKLGKAAKRIAFAASAALIAFLFWSTISRKGENVDLWRQVFIYYIAPLKHFDKYVSQVDSLQPALYGCGGASFYGFLYPILFASKVLSGSADYSEFWTAVRYWSFTKMETPLWIGGDINMNAFVTMFYQPYLDGRFFGVFVICLFFGFLCGFSFRRAYRNGDLKSILIYLLFLQKITDCMVRFYFTQTSQAMCLIYALLVMTPIDAKWAESLSEIGLTRLYDAPNGSRKFSVSFKNRIKRI